MEQEIWQPLKDQGVVIIGLNTGGLGGGDEAHIDDFIKQTGVTFPIAPDTGNTYGRYSAGPSISPFPLDIVIDQQGNIAYLTREYNADTLRNVITSLL